MSIISRPLVAHPGEHLFRHRHSKLKNLGWSKAEHTIDADIIPTASGTQGVGTQDIAFFGMNAQTGRFDDLYATNIYGSIINDVTVNHASLSNLTWSTAGHTMDTTLNMSSNAISNITTATAATFTDGTLTISSGSITNGVNGTFTSTIQAEQLTSTDDIDMTGRLNCNDYVSGLYNPSLTGLVGAGGEWSVFTILDDVYAGAFTSSLIFDTTTGLTLNVGGNDLWYVNTITGDITTIGDVIAGDDVIFNGRLNCGASTEARTHIMGVSGYDTTFTCGAGSFYFDHSEDYFHFQDDIWVPAGEKIYYRGTGQYITSDATQRLDLYGQSSIDLHAPATYISGNLGIGSVNPGASALYIYKNALDTTTNYAGIYSYVVKTAGASVGATFRSAYSYMEFNDTDASANEVIGRGTESRLTLGTVSLGIKGANIIGRIEGGTDSGYLMGLSAKADANAGIVTGNIEHFLDVDIEAGMTSVGGDVNGLRIQVDDDKGATGTVCMLKLDELSGVDYGIYQNGSADNYFNGAICGTDEYLTASGIFQNISTESITASGNIVTDALYVNDKALSAPIAGALEFYDNRMYLTNVAHQRAIDRTSDVAVSTVTVVNTITETTLWTGDMDANSLKAGNVFQFHADGAITNNSANANDEVTIRIKVGGVTKVTLSPDTKQLSNTPWHIEGNATQRTLGAAGARAMHLHLVIGDPITTGDEARVFGVVNINTTANMDVTITAQWASAKANNTISLYQGFMRYKN